METIQFKFNDQIASFESHLEFYLKNKSTDCILYSEDGSKFKVHKEMFGQTNFLREILSNTKEHCCGIIEVLCPCSKEELSSLVNFLYDGEIHCKEESESLKIIENLQNIFGFQRNLVLKYQNEAYFTSDNDIEASTVTGEVSENIPDNSDVQEIIIIPVKEEQFDQENDIYTDQGENDNDFDSKESENDLQVECYKSYIENDNLKNTTAEDIDFRTQSSFEHSSDEKETIVQRDDETISKARNIQKKFKCDNTFEHILDDPDAEKIVIIPLRSKDVSGKLVASDQGKEDHVLQNSEKNVSGKKKKSKKFSQKMVKQPSMKKCSKKFHCNDCGGSFSELQRHINAVHLKIKPYKCEHCQKSFGNLSHLKDHINAIHLKIKPYECDQCKKSFAQNSQLVTHVKIIHQQIKSHKCKELKTSSLKCRDCDTSFVTRNTLKHHVNRVHLKIKPLKKLVCNECKESFEHKQSLEYHINRIHLKIKPYLCDFCKKAFHLGANLKKHLKRTHNDEAN